MSLQFHFTTLDTAPLLAVLVALALGSAARVVSPARAPSPSARAVAAARVTSWALVAVLTVGALLAGGLVIADRRIAHGYALVDAGAPWAESQAAFTAATRFAPWEPATQWALGRGATQAMSARGDLSAFEDSVRALESASARLPLDPLVVAQTADAYLVAGVATRDATKLTAALPFVERAIALDPENGYRWAAKGTALAGLGEADAATAAFERAVRYAPDNAQAWASLGKLYEQKGLSAKAAEAQARADELSTAGP